MYFDNEAFLSMILGVQHVLELYIQLPRYLGTYLCRGSSRVGHVLILIILLLYDIAVVDQDKIESYLTI